MLATRKQLIINSLLLSPLSYTIAAGISFFIVLVTFKLTGLGNRQGFLDLLTVIFLSGLAGSLAIGFVSVCLNFFGSGVQFKNKNLILANFGLVSFFSLSPFLLSIVLGINALLIIPVVSLIYLVVFTLVVYVSGMFVRKDGRENGGHPAEEL